MFKGIVKNNEKLESFIGANSNFKGDIDTKGTLRIDGAMEGKINADWVILGEKASLKGDISAKGIVVGGKVEGNLHAKEIVEIKPKGKVSGDVTTTKFTIFEVGVFDGRSFMQSGGEVKVVELQSKGG
jgi:cytoskeletal protein CcmA (bactofilin family)